MSERKPEDCVVTINAHDFLKELVDESNKLATRGIVLSGRSLFRFTGRIFVEKVREQRAKEETSEDDRFDLQQIKAAPDRDKEIDRQITVVKAKLEALGVVTENLDIH